jgi:hypothetical protein
MQPTQDMAAKINTWASLAVVVFAQNTMVFTCQLVALRQHVSDEGPDV